MCKCGLDVTVGSHLNSVAVELPPHMASYRAARLRAGLSGTVGIDRCILSEIEDLWRAGITTHGSCCGHNHSPSMVNVTPQDVAAMLALGYRQMPIMFPEMCPETFYLKSGRSSITRQCEACEGAGQVVVGEHYVTADMASDAGEPDLAGQPCGVEWGCCEECGGSGEIQVCPQCGDLLDDDGRCVRCEGLKPIECVLTISREKALEIGTAILIEKSAEDES